MEPGVSVCCEHWRARLGKCQNKSGRGRYGPCDCDYTWKLYPDCRKTESKGRRGTGAAERRKICFKHTADQNPSRSDSSFLVLRKGWRQLRVSCISPASTASVTRPSFLFLPYSSSRRCQHSGLQPNSTCCRDVSTRTHDLSKTPVSPSQPKS
jgi:hypothetical protein